MLRIGSATATFLLVLSLLSTAEAQSPSAKDALGLKPVQKSVLYDTPTAAAQEKCTIKAEKVKGAIGWYVRNSGGQLLRRFLDSNDDNKVDRWCYYHQGIEVYRDIDTDFDGKADQYRWLGTAGTRWGLDKDQDGKIDRWKLISAQELTAEMVAAVRDRDAHRFSLLLLSESEITQLGLGTATAKKIRDQIASAKKDFAQFTKRQKTVKSSTKWVNFGGTQPGVIPAGTDGATKDLFVYDNVAAIIENGGKHEQFALGTLISVEHSWRMIGLPATDVSLAGFFFQASLRADIPRQTEEGISKEMQELIQQLETLDRRLATAQGDELSKLQATRAGYIEKLVDAAKTDSERSTWVRQLADTVSGATQAGKYPEGVDRLKKLFDKIKDKTSKSDQAYVYYRYLSAEYAQKLQDPKADFPKIQEKWFEQLEDFVKSYPKAIDASEAMLQLGLASEFAGKADDARKWYGRIVTDFPTAGVAKKAAGAKWRLESIGKQLRLQGNTIDKRAFDISSYRGKTVVIQFWATWCEPCKNDMKTLKTLQAKYAKRGFRVVGVNLDENATNASRFLQRSPHPWLHLHEPGGMEGRIANQLGVLTLPTMLLIDGRGRVINRSIHAAELEDELKKVLK